MSYTVEHRVIRKYMKHAMGWERGCGSCELEGWLMVCVRAMPRRLSAEERKAGAEQEKMPEWFWAEGAAARALSPVTGLRRRTTSAFTALVSLGTLTTPTNTCWLSQ